MSRPTDLATLAAVAIIPAASLAFVEFILPRRGPAAASAQTVTARRESSAEKEPSHAGLPRWEKSPIADAVRAELARPAGAGPVRLSGPAVPVGGPDDLSRAPAAPPAIQTFKLTTILATPSGSVAMIDGKVYSENADLGGGWTLQRVDPGTSCITVRHSTGVEARVGMKRK